MLNAAQRTSVEQHMRLVGDVVQRLQRRMPARVDAEEMYGDGCVGLCEAVQRHDPERASLPTYAAHVVEGAIRYGITRARQAPRHAARDRVVSETTISARSGGAFALDDQASGRDDVGVAVRRDLVMQLLGRLKARERAVVEMIYFAGRSRTEVAQAVGCSLQTVTNTVKRALAKMRRAA